VISLNDMMQVAEGVASKEETVTFTAVQARLLLQALHARAEDPAKYPQADSDDVEVLKDEGTANLKALLGIVAAYRGLEPTFAERCIAASAAAIPTPATQTKAANTANAVPPPSASAAPGPPTPGVVETLRTLTERVGLQFGGEEPAANLRPKGQLIMTVVNSLNSTGGLPELAELCPRYKAAMAEGKEPARWARRH
jgi:hypothetical protein